MSFVTPGEFRASGLTVRAAADALGVSKSSVGAWLVGRGKLSLAHLAALTDLVQPKPVDATVPARVVAPIDAPALPLPSVGALPEAASAHVGAALAELVRLMQGARSESVRAQCATTILAYAHGKPGQHKERPKGPPDADDRRLLKTLEKLSAAIEPPPEVEEPALPDAPASDAAKPA